MGWLLSGVKSMFELRRGVVGGGGSGGMVLIHLMIYVECAKTQNCTTGSKEMDSREEGVY